MKEQWIETLNIMGKGNIYQEYFANIIDLCIKSSRGRTRLKLVEHDRFIRDNKITGEGVTHTEIRNLLENFKTDILGTLTKQLDIMQEKYKKAKLEKILQYSAPYAKRNTATRNSH